MKDHHEHTKYWRQNIALFGDYESLKEECEILEIPRPTQEWFDKQIKAAG